MWLRYVLVPGLTDDARGDAARGRLRRVAGRGRAGRNPAVPPDGPLQASRRTAQAVQSFQDLKARSARSRPGLRRRRSRCCTTVQSSEPTMISGLQLVRLDASRFRPRRSRLGRGAATIPSRVPTLGRASSAWPVDCSAFGRPPWRQGGQNARRPAYERISTDIVRHRRLSEGRTTFHVRHMYARSARSSPAGRRLVIDGDYHSRRRRYCGTAGIVSLATRDCARPYQKRR